MDPDWLGASRRAARAMTDMLAAHPTIAERVVFVELERLHEDGARFTVVSEERGTVDFGGDGTLVVVDPIDGSMNAKRGISHHALSIAVADGPTMADVVFGYVNDIGPGQEWGAWRGRGA